MKYNSLKSFQKQLASSAPHNLCRLYFVGIQDDFERQKAIQTILSFFPEMPTRLSAETASLKEIVDAIQSLSLLGDAVVVIDDAEKIGKKLVPELSKASAVVILGAKGKSADLANAVEKTGVVLDLLEEKPWDKEKRITDELINQAKNAGKTITPDTIALLFERLGNDPALLENELDKLICYAADRNAIKREDVLALTASSKTATLWQMAEEVVWTAGFFEDIDQNTFHGILGAIRSQLHLGASLASLIEDKVPSEEWNKFLPKLWPKTLEKRSSDAARLGKRFFLKGLDHLFDLELATRSGSTEYSALLDLFRAKLYVR